MNVVAPSHSATRHLLEMVGVGGGYTNAPILRDIDLHVDRDEIVGILGANGAGKTTLLRALSGDLPRTSGEVLIDGVAVGHRAAWVRARHGLAVVPEGRHVFGSMTVRENLDVAALVGSKKVPTLEVYDLFPRLGERQNQLAGSMSGGEQQMLAIGRVLMMAPSVVAIDEMSAGLAPLIVDQLVEALMRLRGRGLGVLLVEQSPHFIADAVDRVYVMERGRFVRHGVLADLGGADSLAELYLGVR